MMERIIDGMTEREFLDWLYEVIGDESIDYMTILSSRIEKIKIIELKEKIKEASKGCGKSERAYPDDPNLDRIYKTCGDNRFHAPEDEPNLCKDCKLIYQMLKGSSKPSCKHVEESK